MDSLDSRRLLFLPVLATVKRKACCLGLDEGVGVVRMNGPAILSLVAYLKAIGVRM